MSVSYMEGFGGDSWSQHKEKPYRSIMPINSVLVHAQVKAEDVSSWKSSSIYFINCVKVYINIVGECICIWFVFAYTVPTLLIKAQCILKQRGQSYGDEAFCPFHQKDDEDHKGTDLV